MAKTNIWTILGLGIFLYIQCLIPKTQATSYYLRNSNAQFPPHRYSFSTRSGNCFILQSYSPPDLDCTYCLCFPFNWYNCWTNRNCVNGTKPSGTTSSSNDAAVAVSTTTSTSPPFIDDISTLSTLSTTSTSTTTTTTIASTSLSSSNSTSNGNGIDDVDDSSDSSSAAPLSSVPTQTPLPRNTTG